MRGAPGLGPGGGSRGPRRPQGIFREEEERILAEDGDLHRVDDRGTSAGAPSGDCAEHPGRAATGVCTECGRQLCPDCVYASGGGHAFCKACMEATRLVDAEPKIIGQVVEVEEPASPRTAVLALLVVLAVVALAVAGFFLYGMLTAA